MLLGIAPVAILQNKQFSIRNPLKFYSCVLLLSTAGEVTTSTGSTGVSALATSTGSTGVSKAVVSDLEFASCGSFVPSSVVAGCFLSPVIASSPCKDGSLY